MEKLLHPKFKEETMSKIQGLQLSRRTLTSRAEDLSAMISSNLKSEIQQAKAISICLDESTDLNQIAQLIIFIRIVDEQFQAQDFMLDIQPLSLTTKAEDIFNALKNSLIKFDVPIEKIFSVTTDGASTMRGAKNGLLAKLKDVNKYIVPIHCIIHQESLIAKNGIPCAKKMADKVMIIVNKCISSGALRCRKFQSFLEENDAAVKSIPKMQQVRWLSVFKTFKSFLPIIPEIDTFLKSQSPPIIFEELSNFVWIEQLSFFTDLTFHFSELNLKLQGMYFIYILF